MFKNHCFQAFSYKLIVVFLLVIPGCKQEKVPEPYKPRNAHRAYLFSLEQAGLSDTALGRDWISASEKAWQTPIDISLPYQEFFYVDPAVPFAVAYCFDVLRGQKIEVEANVQSSQSGRLFIDLFRLAGSSGKERVSVASANENEKRLAFEARRDAKYVVRLQPELLRGGRFRLVIRVVPSLQFPVSGRDEHSIRSGFGESRDGGRRRHHGVDIFAARNTPVISPVRAYVHHVGESDRGGNVIWLHSSTRSMYLYFAHLQTQEVRPYTYVEAGQVIGNVGNSGNARTTPPHLHFALYFSGEGPVDPYHFIARTDTDPDPVLVDTETLGQWARSKIPRVFLKTSMDGNGNSDTALDRYTPLKIVAATGKMFRVLLPDGKSGYVPASSVEPIEEEIRLGEVAGPRAVNAIPSEPAVVKEYIDTGEKFFILGMFDGYLFVKTQEGNIGWLPSPSAVQPGG